MESDTQGADGAGTYPVATVLTGSIPAAGSNNYAILCEAPQCALHR
jgi:hypothetical protein